MSTTHLPRLIKLHSRIVINHPPHIPRRLKQTNGPLIMIGRQRRANPINTAKHFRLGQRDEPPPSPPQASRKSPRPGNPRTATAPSARQSTPPSPPPQSALAATNYE